MDNLRQEELPKNLTLAILTAHYDALSSAYKSDLRRRINHILRQHSGGKLSMVAPAMGIHIANECEKAIAAGSHERVEQAIRKAL